MKRFSPSLALVTVTFLSVLSAACSPRSKSSDIASVHLDTYSGKNFLYVDQADRMKVLTDLRDDMALNYSLWDYKREVIGVDGMAVFNDAIQTELSIADPVLDGHNDDFLLAQANYAFYDRALQVAARFKDTHLNFLPMTDRPAVSLGLDLTEVAGHFHVTYYSAKILGVTASKSLKADAANIELGDEVVAIDGKPMAEWVAEYLPYVYASSDLFAHLQAVRAITERTFRYPTKPYADVTVLDDEGKPIVIRLNWYIHGANEGKEVRSYFSKVGISSLKEVARVWSAVMGQWLRDEEGWDGAEANDLPSNMLELKRYSSKADGLDAFATGYLLEKGSLYGVLQLSSFEFSKVYPEGDEDQVLAWSQPISAFLKQLKKNEIPLIIDIRANRGGNPEIARQLLAMLALTDQVMSPGVYSFRVSRSVRQMYEQYDFFAVADPLNDQLSTLGMSVIRDAVANRSTHTRAFQNKAIAVDPAIGGFDVPIVALVGADCISACDLFAKLLRANQRGILVGTATNGTGAGFYGAGNFGANGELRSDRLQVLKYRIPNFLFGFGAVTTDAHVYPEADGFLTLGLENRPTVADIAYQPTLDDALKQSSGWFNAATTVMDAFIDQIEAAAAAAKAAAPAVDDAIDGDDVDEATDPLADPTTPE